jgi:D-serine deaminase-like pyridoxal phosphate-dependent protein
MAAQTLDDLPTPALILDRAILRRNLKRMSERLRSAGVVLRPHLKTAKSVEIGRMAVEGHDGRITVSTLAEARYFADGGFKDILYGVGVVPAKLPAVTELRRRGVNLRVVTDNLAVARAIADAARDGDTFSVFIEIDSGGGRAGLPWPELPGLLDIARVLHQAPGVELAGVMTHAGHSYHESTADGIAAVAEQERQAIVGAAEKLRANGIPCPIVSAGSTPTAVHSRNFAGITEMRPGVYVFNDLDQEFIGTCGADDLALSVLASVIGHYPHRNEVLVDAGALALSKDAGPGDGRRRLLAGARVRRRRRADPLRQSADRRSRAHFTQSRLHHRRRLRPLLRGRQRTRRRQVGGRGLRSHQRLVIA